MIESAVLPRDAERRAECHMMVDIESIAQDPGGIVFAIAAVPFDPYAGSMGKPFFVLVDPLDSMRHGLFPDPNTIKWWGTQDPKARAYLDAAYTDGLPLPIAMQRFAEYVQTEVGPKDSVRLWGKGGDFDKPFLDLTYKACSVEKPWGPRACRCYRSLEAFSVVAPPKRTLTGVAHHALDDTIHQVKCAIPALRHIYGLPALTSPILDPPVSAWVEDPIKGASFVALENRARRFRIP